MQRENQIHPQFQQILAAVRPVDALPIRECAVCRKYDLAVKLIPVYRGEQQIAWQEVDALSPSLAVREPIPAKIVEPTQADYIALLKRHDWQYQYADDGRVFREGDAARKALEAMQAKFDSDFVIWNRHAPEAFRRNVVEVA